jgi:hypothetical protein
MALRSGKRGVGTGGGTFTPTLKRIEIDLSNLYHLSPKTPAAITLQNILQNYRGAEVVALVNISPDVGLEVFKDYDGVAGKIFREEEDDVVAEEKVAKELAKRLQKDIAIVTLLDGYEAGIAFVVMKE